MKALNDNTIKQLGNGILAKVKEGCSLRYPGTFTQSTSKIQLFDSRFKEGDIISVVNSDGITYCIGITSIPIVEEGIDISYYLVSKINDKDETYATICLLDKFGNTLCCDLNKTDCTLGNFSILDRVIPITYNIDCTNTNDHLLKIINTDILNYRKGDKIKIESDEESTIASLFCSGIFDVVDNYITRNSTISGTLTLSRTFSKNETVTYEIAYYKNTTNSNFSIDSSSYISTNCPCILKTNNTIDSLTYPINSVCLPNSRKYIASGDVVSRYIPKQGDVIESNSGNIYATIHNFLRRDLNNYFIVLSCGHIVNSAPTYWYISTYNNNTFNNSNSPLQTGGAGNAVN